MIYASQQTKGLMMTEEEIAVECERRFQNGGSKVYIVHKGLHYWTFKPSHNNCKRTIELAFEDEQIWSRRKIGGIYRWRATHKAISK